MSSGFLRGLALSIISGLAFTGCSLSGQKPGLITPAQATGVVKTFWNQNNKALQSGEPGVWTQLEAGLQEQYDEANTVARLATKSPSLQPSPISDIRVYVSRQTSYPIFFTASLTSVTHDAAGRNTSTPDIGMLDFSKPSSSDRWKLINSVSLGTNPLPQFPFDSDGYVVAPDHAGAASLKAANVSSAWADFVNGVIAGKPDSAVFAPGDMTTTLATKLKTDAAGSSIDAVHVQAFPEQGYQSQTASDGSLFVFFTATYDLRHMLANGVCAVQDANRKNWGGLVAPGRYGVIDYKLAVFGLAVVPPRSTRHKVQVYGYEGEYHAVVAGAGC